MSFRKLSLFAMCLLAAMGAAMRAETARAQLRTTSLKCEYAVNPIGIDEPHPRLSWLLNSQERGARQNAYQIVVASTEANADAGRGDLWDSGKVASSAQNQIAYDGPPVGAKRRVWWNVRTWDGNDRVSGWSAPAWWESGLGSRANWGAQWISPQPELPQLNEAAWIWTNEGSLQAGMPAGRRYFRWQFTLHANFDAAQLVASVDDQWRIWINGQLVTQSDGQEDAWKRPTQLDVRQYLRIGDNTIAVEAQNNGNAAGVLAQLQFQIGDAKVVLSSDNHWKWSAENTTGWQNPDFDAAGWQDTRELGQFGIAPWGRTVAASLGAPERYLRRQFSLDNPIKSARLYATALGLYEARINGHPVGSDKFAPGWTDYTRRVQYQTYDVTDLVQRGDNALAFTLGKGWYCGRVGLNAAPIYGTRPFLMCRLEVEYADGTRKAIVSDDSWRANRGPITRDDLFDGESFDAGLAVPNWDTAAFDDHAWPAAHTFNGRDGNVDLNNISIEAQRGPGVRATQELQPKAFRQVAPGRWVFDLGQNMVGWARLQTSAPPGTKLTLRFAEMLKPDGTIYTDNYRGALCTDEYICRGDGRETWEPGFTFRGFRYVEVSGLTTAPDANTITGIVAHSDTPETSALQTSSPLVNQLQHNIEWGQRGNFLSVPTDCPQRDERLGWMGDAQIFVRTATYNADVAAFFEKWMVDVQDAQTNDGAFSDVSPRATGGSGTAAWADAGIIVPWTIYLSYGDTRILSDHYEAMAKFIAWCQQHSNNGIRPAEGYGDWLSINADTPKDVLATAYFAYSTHLMAQIAGVLGKTEDAQRYQNQFEAIKAAFNREFVAEDGRIKGNTQTDYVLALRFELLPIGLRERATQYLVDDIAAKDGHLSTGFVGVGYLNPVLTENGHSEVAYQLLLNDTFPSWGYSIRQGATTIWERWDGWTQDKGFQNAGMNSFNHYSLGSVGEWMFDSVAGIGLDPSQPGYAHILIQPQPDPRLDSASAHYDSIRGRIESSWQRGDGTFTLSVSVPVNTTATVWVPNALPNQVREGLSPAGEARGVKYLAQDGDAATYEVGAGQYRFQVTTHPPTPHEDQRTTRN